MTGKGKHRFSPREARRGRVQSACSCGWAGIGTDKTETSAAQSWMAHMYAQGFRTRAEIEAAAA